MPRGGLVPPEVVERFLTTVSAVSPGFDVVAARASFLKIDSLYEFDLPLPEDRADQLRQQIDAALDAAGIPGGTGRSVGTKLGWFVLYRNF